MSDSPEFAGCVSAYDVRQRIEHVRTARPERGIRAKQSETPREAFTMTDHVTRTAPDFAADRDLSDAAIKLVRKLRWIGKEEEARSVERRLSLMPPTVRGSVLAEPISRD